jgi:hypothetical protein
MNEKKEIDENELNHDREVWKVALETQMHFNDLLIKSRTTVITVALAVVGATTIALKETNIFFKMCGWEFHVAAIVPLLGVFFLFGQFLIDYYYYFRLLIGAVGFTKELDEKYKARWMLMIFYIIPILLGVVLIVLIILLGPEACPHERTTWPCTR